MTIPRSAPPPLPQAPPSGERRSFTDRRTRPCWSVIYGNFNPRRRRQQRGDDAPRFFWPDWHHSHLLAVSIGILLMSVADAFMTVTLLDAGAIEVNPVMAAVVQHSAARFAAVKMAMTGAGVIFLVVNARHRVLRIFRVDVVMYVLLIGYLLLLSYELRMLRYMSHTIGG